MPEEMRLRLVEAAERAKRSLNSEILWRLDDSFGQQLGAMVAEIERRERFEKELYEKYRKDPEWLVVIDRIIKETINKKGKA
jgi:hypothetical protein